MHFHFSEECIGWNYCFHVTVSLNKKLVLTTIYRRTKEQKRPGDVSLCVSRTSHRKETLKAYQG